MSTQGDLEAQGDSDPRPSTDLDVIRRRRRLLTQLPAASDIIRRETVSVAREALKGGTWGDTELLGRLCFDFDGEARPSELTGVAYTTSTGVTGSLRRLEDAGLVERKRTENDRRVLLACITESGRAAIKAALPAIDALAQERFSHLSDSELNLLLEFVEQQFER